MKARLTHGRTRSQFVCALAAGALIATAPLAQLGRIAPDVRSQSSTQMSSEPELVYINTVSDSSVRTQNFNENWKFYLGDASGAEGEQFDDSAWKNVDLPHDYSIDQEYTTAGEAESGYKLGGIGWYRKSFTVGEASRARRSVSISMACTWTLRCGSTVTSLATTPMATRRSRTTSPSTLSSVNPTRSP